MSLLKKTLGIFWILLAPATTVVLFMQAIEKTYALPEGAQRTNAALQWGIILFIFIPIAIGLVIFGVYSLKGEYDEKNES